MSYKTSSRLPLYIEIEESLQSKGFKYLGSGCGRVTYSKNKNTVIKVPKDYGGIDANKMEAAAYKHYRNSPTDREIILAACRLLKNGCLIMRYADYIYCDYPNYPHWASRIDGAQVGVTRHNKIVAYDYAFDVPNFTQEVYA